MFKETADIDLSSFFDVFLPIKTMWENFVEHPLAAFLTYLVEHLQTVPFIDAVGAYGVAIVILTIMIRLALAPLQQFQLVTQRRTMVEQRKLAPEVAELRKKFKKDPQRLNQEMMKLYQEHGVNPLGGLVGCLPLVVQIPILTALYYVFQGFAASAHVAAPFLFVPNLNLTPAHHAIFTIAGVLPIPSPVYLVFPLLAALTTLIQSRMLMMPPPLNPTEQELQTAQMQRTMVWLSPLMIGYFSLQVPAGLGLYWFIGNCVSIIQQYFVVGWGNLWPRGSGGGSAPAVVTKGGNGPRSGPKPTLKPAPQNGPRNGPRSGPRNGSRPRRPKK
ncbi:MAG TPA: YidC/Oxa1 family membrane protein insertase [Candidatus Dormibacteraeota bacterium]